MMESYEKESVKTGIQQSVSMFEIGDSESEDEDSSVSNNIGNFVFSQSSSPRENSASPLHGNENNADPAADPNATVRQYAAAESKSDVMSLMQQYQQHIKEIQCLRVGTEIDINCLAKEIGDTQVYEAIKIRLQKKPLNKFVPFEFNSEGKAYRYIVLCLNQLIVVEVTNDKKQTVQSSPSLWRLGSEGLQSKESAKAAAVEMGHQLAGFMKRCQDKAKDAWESANKSGNPADLLPAAPYLRKPDLFQTAAGIVDLKGNSQVRCTVKSNHRIQTLSKITFQEGSQERICLIYKHGKKNTYDIRAYEAFLESLKRRLASLNVGMRITDNGNK